MIGLQRAILYCYFYSRPCGRGDSEGEIVPAQSFLFLLTPLREGRPCLPRRRAQRTANFYSRPCGRGDKIAWEYDEHRNVFLLTPLREGRLYRKPGRLPSRRYFYSRPCGRGDRLRSRTLSCTTLFLLTPLREGRRLRDLLPVSYTHLDVYKRQSLNRPELPFGFSGLFPRSLGQLKIFGAVLKGVVGADDSVGPENVANSHEIP